MIIPSEQGRIEVSEQVLIEAIARIARSLGLAKVTPRSRTENIVDWLGFEGKGREVVLRMTDEGLIVELQLHFRTTTGITAHVRDIVRELQTLLEERLLQEVAEINVTIMGTRRVAS